MRNSIVPATRGCAVAPPLTVDPLDNSIDNHADPEVHQQSEIKALGTMASRRWQVRHQDEKINQVAHDNGNQLLEESAEHGTVVHQRTNGRRYSLFAFCYSPEIGREHPFEAVHTPKRPLAPRAKNEGRSADSQDRSEERKAKGEWRAFLIYHPSVLELSTNVQFVKGIGPRFAQILLEKGITTVEDLLYYLPFRYEDRLNPRGIGELRAGEMASVIASVRGFGLFRTRRMPIFEMTVGEGRGTLKCIWFNATYLQDKFRAGQLVALYGKVEASTRGGDRLQIMQPQFEILYDPTEGGKPANEEERKWQTLEMGRIVPVYETAGKGKLTARWFRRIIHGMLEQLDQDVADAIPRVVRGRMGLIDRKTAFWHAHWPEVGESLANLQSARTPALFRLIFEELFFLELGLELKRRKMRAQSGVSFAI